ncbi:MAG: 30S ribosomal protein S9 [Hydrogenobacter thermophilus]|uniref:30S ribosomal protein S9 n=1 Tax=Hydrogenobacter thermophilus TaxID=940 RepID=UPI000CC79E4C|nr:30S ribosomal protein S9 [Hydrogenobacter thermophilus]QWK20047.1 MAG: 30S ribosomal protein S9 [Hydrogenobacter thermophilus]GBC88576.1 30S ribosomal protein S9 [bacterium HR13]
MITKLKDFRIGFDNAYYGTGRRKESIARVWLLRNTDKMIVKAKDSGKEFLLKDYVQRSSLFNKILYPLKLTGLEGKFGIYATVEGGGISGQAEAIMYGIAKALLKYNPDLRPTLKKAGLLKRDAREKERKKYGLMKARKGYRWSKR